MNKKNKKTTNKGIEIIKMKLRVVSDTKFDHLTQLFSLLLLNGGKPYSISRMAKVLGICTKTVYRYCEENEAILKKENGFIHLRRNLMAA
jgi:predicted AAA+ superfamily ATPase